MGGALTATATTGNLIDSGTVTVGSGASFTTLQNNADIDLGTLAVTGTVTLSTTGATGNATVVNATALDLGTSAVGGALTATATTGNINQSGALNVGGTASFTTGANPADILLADFANSLAGAVTFSQGGGDLRDVALRNISPSATFPIIPVGLRNLTLIYNNASIVLPTITLAGNGNFVGTAITQSGPLDVTGPSSTFTATQGAVILNDTGNRFRGGPASLDLTGSNVDVFVSSAPFADDSDALDQVTAPGSFILRTTPNRSFGLLGAAGDFQITLGDLDRFNVGTFNPIASGTGAITVGTGAPLDWNVLGIGNLALTTTGAQNITVTGVRFITGNLALVSGGDIVGIEDRVHRVAGLGPIQIGALAGDFDFRNAQGMNLNGTVSIPGRLTLEVAGQFYNQTGSATPLAGVQGGSVVKSLSLAGGLPNLISGLAGFGVRYDGVMPTSGNVMSYAVSPLTMFAPGGTVIAGVDLSGTQTGGGQLNTFFTGSDNLNWMIADFGKFNLPKVEPSRMEYMLYQQRVEPETRSLPQPVMRELTQELGRPPTVEELQAREVARRQAVQMRSGAILERSSFDEDVPETKQEAMGPGPILDGGKPQAGGPSFAPSPASAGGASSSAKASEDKLEGFGPQAKKQTDTKRDPNGPMLRSGQRRAVAQLRPAASGEDAGASQGLPKASIHQILQDERERAEVGIAPPVAATPR